VARQRERIKNFCVGAQPGNQSPLGDESARRPSRALSGTPRDHKGLCMQQNLKNTLVVSGSRCSPEKPAPSHSDLAHTYSPAKPLQVPQYPSPVNQDKHPSTPTNAVSRLRDIAPTVTDWFIWSSMGFSVATIAVSNTHSPANRHHSTLHRDVSTCVSKWVRVDRQLKGAT